MKGFDIVLSLTAWFGYALGGCSVALLKASNNILHTFLTKTETSTTFCGSRLLPVGFLL